MAIRNVSNDVPSEQPEDIKLEIEGLRTEIEEAGNKLVDELNEFEARLKDSQDPSERDEARVALQRLKAFTLQTGATEAPTGSTSTAPSVPAPAGPSASKKEEVKQMGTSLWKRIVENAREGGSSKSSTPEPKA